MFPTLLPGSPAPFEAVYGEVSGAMALDYTIVAKQGQPLPTPLEGDGWRLVRVLAPRH